MVTGSMLRRIAAALTAAIVAMTLVTLGGPAHAVRPIEQNTAVSGHSSAMPAVARALQVDKLGSHELAPTHLDLASTPPTESGSVRTTAVTGVPSSSQGILQRHAAAPTGRAPPAL